MISGTGHDHTLDWWALGILLYEMIVGLPPFYNKNLHHMYLLIKRTDVKWPSQDRHGVEVSKEAKDLISKVSTLLIYLSYVIQ
jgi:serine/threonine protein kinase